SMLGTYSATETGFRFEPRFPLQPGVEYLAVFDSSQPPLARSPGLTIRATFKLPKPAAAATTVVEHVYPTVSHLPENQLKFYLHFSAPMSRGDAYKHVHLIESPGKEVDMP